MSIPIVPLGSQGLRVSKQGLGCMGMSAFYGSDDEKESVATLERAHAHAAEALPRDLQPLAAERNDRNAHGCDPSPIGISNHVSDQR